MIFYLTAAKIYARTSCSTFRNNRCCTVEPLCVSFRVNQGRGEDTCSKRNNLARNGTFGIPYPFHNLARRFFRVLIARDWLSDEATLRAVNPVQCHFNYSLPCRLIEVVAFPWRAAPFFISNSAPLLPFWPSFVPCDSSEPSFLTVELFWYNQAPSDI